MIGELAFPCMNAFAGDVELFGQPGDRRFNTAVVFDGQAHQHLSQTHGAEADGAGGTGALTRLAQCFSIALQGCNEAHPFLTAVAKIPNLRGVLAARADRCRARTHNMVAAHDSAPVVR